ncbi:MAG: hypothetical protein AABZ80_03945 [Gemmatimonadota bacterium]
MTSRSDQRVGKDAKDRYAFLRSQLNGVMVDVDKLLGPDRQSAIVP